MLKYLFFCILFYHSLSLCAQEITSNRSVPSDTIRLKNKGKIIGEIISISKDSLYSSKSPLQSFLKDLLFPNTPGIPVEILLYYAPTKEVIAIPISEIDTIITLKNLKSLPSEYRLGISQVAINTIRPYIELQFGLGVGNSSEVRGNYGQGFQTGFSLGILPTAYFGVELNLLLTSNEWIGGKYTNVFLAPMFILTGGRYFEGFHPYLKFGVATATSTFPITRPAESFFIDVPHGNGVSMVNILVRELGNERNFYPIAKIGASFKKISNFVLKAEATGIYSTFQLNTAVRGARLVRNESGNFNSTEVPIPRDIAQRYASERRITAFVIGFNLGFVFEL